MKASRSETGFDLLEAQKGDCCSQNVVRGGGRKMVWKDRRELNLSRPAGPEERFPTVFKVLGV